MGGGQLSHVFLRQRSSIFLQGNMPVRGILTRAFQGSVPRTLSCRCINKSALRGFAAKAKQAAPKKGPIHKGNGIYTAHVEKLFKLQNGYFILFLHKQAVSVNETGTPTMYLVLCSHSCLFSPNSGTQYPCSTCDSWSLLPSYHTS